MGVGFFFLFFFWQAIILPRHRLPPSRPSAFSHFGCRVQAAFASPGIAPSFEPTLGSPEERKARPSNSSGSRASSLRSPRRPGSLHAQAGPRRPPRAPGKTPGKEIVAAAAAAAPGGRGPSAAPPFAPHPLSGVKGGQERPWGPQSLPRRGYRGRRLRVSSTRPRSSWPRTPIACGQEIPTKLNKSESHFSVFHHLGEGSGEKAGPCLFSVLGLLLSHTHTHPILSALNPPGFTERPSVQGQPIPRTLALLLLIAPASKSLNISSSSILPFISLDQSGASS